MSPTDLAVIAGIIALAAVVQGVSGFGFSLVSMPLLAALVGVETALAVQTALGIASNGSTAVRSRHDVLGGTVARMLSAIVVGMPFGWLILARVDASDLKMLVGIIVALLAIVLALRVQIKATGPAVDFVAGFLAGVLSTSTGTNGPPLVIGLSGRQLPAANQRATLSTCFATSSVIVFFALVVSGRVDKPVMLAVATSLPVLIVASTTGHRIFHRLQQHHYQRVVVMLLLASAAVAVGSALTD